MPEKVSQLKLVALQLRRIDEKLANIQYADQSPELKAREIEVIRQDIARLDGIIAGMAFMEGDRND